MTAVAAPAPAQTPAAAPVPTKRRRPSIGVFLLIPGFLWLAVFFLVPLVFLGSQSIQTGTIEEGFKVTWHFGNYSFAFSNFASQFFRSLIYALLATVFSLLIGYPLAYAIAQKAGRFKSLLLVIVIAPFFTSFLLRTLAWQTILSTNGVVFKVFKHTGLLSVTGWLNLTNGNQLLNSPLAVVAGLTYNFLPFMVLPLFANLDRLDPRLLEAGGDLYAAPIKSFWHITLPLSMPGIVAGTLLTFIPAAGDYVNAQLLGNTNTNMIGNVIDGQFLRVLDYPVAAALSVTLMVTIVVLVAVYVSRAGTEELV
ncbi:ABC transporter permease [Jatrophihabitans telluris]|uniref:ABC transporter permease n=1 Tax=Jatrophihabitans telluris TaxID=2038343 RepID=A0ABY4R3S9_9ACTN|nr:ABC transporter permease [Jatrophihabitans telluris]UQX90028.1 ABC transporter permease [Jatrophihabitans telluris]